MKTNSIRFVENDKVNATQEERYSPDYYSPDFVGYCGNEDNPITYICTRPKGHMGRHVAHGGDDRPLAAWESLKKGE